MTSRKANRAVIRGQLKGAAISVMDALNEELNAGMPAGQLRDAAESLRALAEVLGQAGKRGEAGGDGGGAEEAGGGAGQGIEERHGQKHGGRG